MSTFGICIVIILHGLQWVLAAANPTTSISSLTDSLTCPSRTINYLTHTLPQLCLASSRTVLSDSNNADESTITIAASSHLPLGTSTSAANSESSITSQEKDSVFTDASSAYSIAVPATHPTNPSVTARTATSAANVIPVSLLPETADEESPLENGGFLSFEEWKKQNLIKAGQSEHLGRTGRAEPREPRLRPGNVHNTLDSLGDDVEIDLDFSGLVAGSPDTIRDREQRRSGQDTGNQDGTASNSRPKTRARGKDAGTTCKERFNYASYDCAANVLKSNTEAQNPNLVLRENKDLYMLNKCSASNKFIIFELCDDILIDTMVLANFEFFSSSFRTFSVSVSDRYPIKTDKWKSLGTFEARNTREIQAFLVEDPVIWARYVRIEFLTQYSNEFYCPVSLVRVHGTTMLEEYKHDQHGSMEEDEEENESVVSADSTEDKLVPEAIDELLLVEQEEKETPVAPAEQYTQTFSSTSMPCRSSQAAHMDKKGLVNETTPNQEFLVWKLLLAGDTEVCPSDSQSMFCNYGSGDDVMDSINTSPKTAATPALLSKIEKLKNISFSAESHTSSSMTTPNGQSTGQNTNSPKQKPITSTGNKLESKKSVPTAVDHSKLESTAKDATRPHGSKPSGSGTQSQPASPTVQESFFKSVQKRLQMLESNASLSLQYVEDQSKALREALRKAEQRQISKTSTFLDHLNLTVLNELKEFRQQYEQLWQSTVIELESQREQYLRESQAMNARLGILADELIFQRRVSMLQMILILVCLGLVLFSRGALGNYLELPLVQSVLSRSPSSKWNNTPRESRTASPALTRTRSAQQLGSKQGILKRHNRGLSEESHQEPFSGSEIYSPPTPVSFDGYSDAELIKADSKMDDPEFDPINIERPSTSPPILPGLEDPTTPRSIIDLDVNSIDTRLLAPLSVAGGMNEPGVKMEHPTPTGRHLTWDLPE